MVNVHNLSMHCLAFQMTCGSLGNFTQSTSVKIVLEKSLFLTEWKSLDGERILKRREEGEDALLLESR